MSYTLTIYPAEVMRAIKAGADWEEVEDVLLEPSAKKRVLTKLGAYGYQLAHQRDGVSEYEKDLAVSPFRSVCTTPKSPSLRPTGMASARFSLTCGWMLRNSPTLRPSRSMIPNGKNGEVTKNVADPRGDLTVVRADASHLAALVPLFDGYRQFYGQASDPAGARTFLGERLARGESVIFLALDGAVPLGFTQLYPSFTSVGLRPIWILNDLFVAPRGRGHGVGRALLERARQHGLETGAARLTLSTAVDNGAAQSLYEAQGWERDERFSTYNLPL